MMAIVDTSGDLELALKLDQEERKYLEQSRNDEALARELQARLERGEVVSEDEEEEEEEENEEEEEEHQPQPQRRRQPEVEIGLQPLPQVRQQQEEEEEEEDDDDDDGGEAGSDEDILHQSPHIRRHGGEAGPSLEALLQQLGLRLDPRRVHFAGGLDHVIGGFGGNQGTDPSILEQLPTRKYVKPSKSSSSLQNCSICLADFENDDEVTSLPCFHWFHKPEITQWLSTNNSCPICKTTVSF